MGETAGDPQVAPTNPTQSRDARYSLPLNGEGFTSPLAPLPNAPNVGLGEGKFVGGREDVGGSSIKRRAARANGARDKLIDHAPTSGLGHKRILRTCE